MPTFSVYQCPKKIKSNKKKSQAKVFLMNKILNKLLLSFKRREDGMLLEIDILHNNFGLCGITHNVLK